MRIDADGNVGIGTTNPLQKLDVSGNINFNTNGTAILMSSYKGANSDGYNLFIGGGGQSSIGEAGATHKGSYNTSQGYAALNSNTTGYQNSAQGMYALYHNTTGNQNSAQGYAALNSNTTGNNNSAQGVNALKSNTTGNYNSAQGVSALYSNTTGYYNSAQGVNALNSNTTGIYNSAQGAYALRSNTTGYYNSAQGMYALLSNTTGNQNSAQGYAALNSNTTGYYNSAQGAYALRSNTTGYYNSAQGVYALYDLRPTSLAISAFADYSGTVAGTVKATSNTHGRSSGNSLIISGTVSYNGTYTITVIDADNFYFTKAWVATETGWWTLAGQLGSNNTAVGYNTGRGITYGSGNLILGASVTGLSASLTNNIILASGGVVRQQFDGTNWNFTGALAVAAGFGCNTKTAQTAYASGGDITPGAGAYGADSEVNFAAMVTLVKNMRIALVANGIMS